MKLNYIISNFGMLSTMEISKDAREKNNATGVTNTRVLPRKIARYMCIAIQSIGD